jgi:hypothetical protein
MVIPLWSYTGMAAIVVVSEFIVFSMIFYTLSKELKHRVQAMRFALPCGVFAILYAAALAMHSLLDIGKDTVAASALTAVIEAVIIVVLYLVLGLGAGMFRKSTLQELNDLLKVEA